MELRGISLGKIDVVDGWPRAGIRGICQLRWHLRFLLRLLTALCRSDRPSTSMVCRSFSASAAAMMFHHRRWHSMWIVGNPASYDIRFDVLSICMPT
nr:hypothetical protein CFP56_30001 [Quercus suber]